MILGAGFYSTTAVPRFAGPFHSTRPEDKVRIDGAYFGKEASLMEDLYKFETFSADASSFDQDFTNFLNSKRRDSWKVKTCTYCHDDAVSKTYASCIFKRKS